MATTSDLELLRKILMRELETINEYQEMARTAQSEEIRELILHISNDEEEHVAECIQWMQKLNPTLDIFMKRPINAEHFTSSALNVGSQIESRVVPQLEEDNSSNRTTSNITRSSINQKNKGFTDNQLNKTDDSNLYFGGTLITKSGFTVGNLFGKPFGSDNE